MLSRPRCPAGSRVACSRCVVPPLCAVCREPELDGRALCLDVRRPSGRASRSTLPALRRAAGPRARLAVSECRGRALAFRLCLVGVRVRGDGARRRRRPQGARRAGPRRASWRMRSRRGRLTACSAGRSCPSPSMPADGAGTASTRRRRSPVPLGRSASLPVRDVLRRVHTPAQVGLERRSRLRNARGSVRMRAGAARPAARRSGRRRLHDRSDPRCLRPGAAATQARRRSSRSPSPAHARLGEARSEPSEFPSIENAAGVRSIMGPRSIETGQGGVRCRSRSELATRRSPTRSGGTSRSASRRWPNRSPISPGWRSSCGWSAIPRSRTARSPRRIST